MELRAAVHEGDSTENMDCIGFIAESLGAEVFVSVREKDAASDCVVHNADGDHQHNEGDEVLSEGAMISEELDREVDDAHDLLLDFLNEVLDDFDFKHYAVQYNARDDVIQVPVRTWVRIFYA